VSEHLDVLFPKLIEVRTGHNVLYML
jgi:hypothetical protein